MTITVGTWNLENLFRPGGLGGPSTDTAYTAKLDALATTIRQLAPDVLGVQEVGDPDALKDLAAMLAGYEHTATATPDGRGIRVGFLSRLPLQNVREVAAFPDGLRPIQVDNTSNDVSAVGRAVLIAQVETAGHTMSLVTFHLKSKLLTFPGGRFSTRMKLSAPASGPSRSTGAPPRRSPSGRWRPSCWQGTDKSGLCSCWAT